MKSLNWKSLAVSCVLMLWYGVDVVLFSSLFVMLVFIFPLFNFVNESYIREKCINDPNLQILAVEQNNNTWRFFCFTFWSLRLIICTFWWSLQEHQKQKITCKQMTYCGSGINSNWEWRSNDNWVCASKHK